MNSFASADARSKQISKILIIEDDLVLSDLVAGLLRKQGYQVEQSFDGISGLATATSGDFHIILLDGLLPEMDGFEVLDRLRQTSDVPVLMITARGAEADRITGFKTGADDYLPKPFNPEELLLRIEAIIKRTQRVLGRTHGEPLRELQFSGMVIDLIRNQAEYSGHALELTNMEFKLLLQLLEHQGEVLSKPYLYHELMGRAYSRDERSLDVHMSKLRRKLSIAGFDGKRITTVHGLGYRLK